MSDKKHLTLVFIIYVDGKRLDTEHEGVLRKITGVDLIGWDPVKNESFIGKSEGNYKLRPGMRVTIKMVGEDIEGEYMSDVVVHTFDKQNGYITEFNLKRNMLS